MTILRKIAPYVLVAVAAALYLLPFVRVFTWSPDEGIYENDAQLVVQGALPDRDFFEFNAPGEFYWLALFLKLFGSRVLTLRILLLCIGVATALLVFHLARRIGGSGIFPAAFVIATSIPLMVMNSPHYDANFFTLLSFTIFLAAERKLASESSQQPTGRWMLFLVGLLAGWTSCLIQQKGVLLVLALFVSLALLHRKNRFRFTALLLAGYCVPLIAVLLFYASQKAIGDLLYVNLILPLSIYRNFNPVAYGFPLWELLLPNWFRVAHSIFPLPLALAFVGALSVPFLLLLVLPLATAILGCLRRSTAFQRPWWPYWFTAIALWASELHRLDIGHLRDGCAIFIVLFFTLCETHPRRFPKQLVLVILACVVLNGTINLFGATSDKTVIHTRRGTLLAAHPDTALEFLLTHTKPGDFVFIYPHRPIYYFLADVKNPTRICCFMYDRATNDLFRQAVHDLDAKKVRYVLWDSVFSGENLRSLFPAYRLPPPDQLIIEPYLESHYHQIGFENGFRILERNGNS